MLRRSSRLCAMLWYCMERDVELYGEQCAMKLLRVDVEGGLTSAGMTQTGYCHASSRTWGMDIGRWT